MVAPLLLCCCCKQKVEPQPNNREPLGGPPRLGAGGSTSDDERSAEPADVSARGTFVMGKKVRELRRPGAWPGRGVPFKDPVYHTTVVRVTDRGVDGYRDKGIKQEYARTDPENSDGTLLVLRGTEANWYLYDARSFKKLRDLDMLGAGVQEAEPRWDASNPGLLYHLHDMKLMALDVRSGKNRVVHDFKREFPWGAQIATGSEGDASVDRRRWCFMVRKKAGDDEWAPRVVISYDRTADRIVGRMKVTRPIDALTTSMSGRHCVIGWDERPATAHPFDLGKTVKLPKGVTGHQDMALTRGGKDVSVYQNVDTDEIAMADLDTGRETSLVAIPFDVNPDLGLHFSGNCARTPGWVLVSTYSALKIQKGRRRSWMDRQLFMVELKRSPRIWRIAQVNTVTRVRVGGGDPYYYAEPFAAINTAGTRVYWGSNWEGGKIERIETFVALLPAGWPRQLPR
jgi:hypothetical protein